jgi:alkanesulfonate monooxygenase SsuD/methylene tetrahydromethanopterin reductase-like flavin-dependent oxidoreductase (luciferase family)
MQIGVLILPEHSWSEAQHSWRLAEEIGFDHAWTYDHLTWRAFRNQTWFAALPTLTAAALVTKKIRLGTLVASPNFRHPLPFVKDLLALDDISAGRFMLGIGAGGSGWDATMLGQEAWSQRERADRFAEFVKLTDLLLRQPETTYKGTFYSAHEARTYPGCVQTPRLPFAIAATGKRGMRLAAEYGQFWVTNGDRSIEETLGPAEGAEVVRQQMLQVDEICEQVRRDPASLRRLVLGGPRLDSGLTSPAAFQETVAQYAEIGVTDFVVHWPRPSEPYAADLATFEQIFSNWQSK